MSEQSSTSRAVADRQRSAVYAAETAIAATLEEGGTVEHYGSTLTVEAERRFGDLAGVQRYVEQVLALGPVAALPRAAVPVRVRERRGDAQAHYERRGATIALPTHRGTGWAMRETVVLHELAHHLDPDPVPAHGPSFTATLVRLYDAVMGAEAAHLLRTSMWDRGVLVAGGSGVATTTTGSGSTATGVLDKMSKVLAQAERAATPEEATAFFEKAQAMATRYSIDLAVARQHVARQEKRETPLHRTVVIGERRQVGNRHHVRLFLAIAHVNDVRANVAHDSTVVLPYGFPSDLDVVEALYAHLATHMATAAADYLATGGFRDHQVWSPSRRAWVPVAAKAARLAFYDSYVETIADRLRAARDQAEAAAVTTGPTDPTDPTGPAVPSGTSSTALALADKRAEVQSFYDQHSEARGSWSGWRGRTADVPSAHRAGTAAGRTASLTGARSLPGGARSIA